MAPLIPAMSSRWKSSHEPMVSMYGSIPGNGERIVWHLPIVEKKRTDQRYFSTRSTKRQERAKDPEMLHGIAQVGRLSWIAAGAAELSQGSRDRALVWLVGAG